MHAAVDAIKGANKLTRMVMRISPEEMDRDPIFAFNNELPDVVSDLEATFTRVCSRGWYPYDQTRLTIPGFGSWIFEGVMPGELNNGGKVGNNAVDDRFINTPWAHVIEVLDETGQGLKVHESEIDLIDGIIAGAKVGQPTLPKKYQLKTGGPRWNVPDKDTTRKFVEKRDDSKCTVFHAVKPWQTAGEVATAKTRVQSGGVGCTASFGSNGGGAFGLFGIALFAFGLVVVRRRRSRQAG